MAEARSNTQLPFTPKSVIQDEVEAFQHGIEIGRQYADVARRRVAAWAEEHPGQMLLIGLAGGFVLGKLLFHPRAKVKKKLDLSDLELD